MSDYIEIVQRAAEVLACSEEAMSSRVFDTLTLDFARAVVEMGKELAQLHYRLQTWDDVHAERRPTQSDEEYAVDRAGMINLWAPQKEIRSTLKLVILTAIQRGREQARAEDAATERKLDAKQARRDAPGPMQQLDDECWLNED